MDPRGRSAQRGGRGEYGIVMCNLYQLPRSDGETERGGGGGARRARERATSTANGDSAGYMRARARGMRVHSTFNRSQESRAQRRHFARI